MLTFWPCGCECLPEKVEKLYGCGEVARSWRRACWVESVYARQRRVSSALVFGSTGSPGAQLRVVERQMGARRGARQVQW